MSEEQKPPAEVPFETDPVKLDEIRSALRDLAKKCEDYGVPFMGTLIHRNNGQGRHGVMMKVSYKPSEDSTTRQHATKEFMYLCALTNAMFRNRQELLDCLALGATCLCREQLRGKMSEVLMGIIKKCADGEAELPAGIPEGFVGIEIKSDDLPDFLKKALEESDRKNKERGGFQE